MATSKRPAVRKNDRVTLSAIKKSIPSYGGKPWVLRDTVLTVMDVTGTGSTRTPWVVVVTDGEHLWRLEPGDVERVETPVAHSTRKPAHSTEKDLDTWLARHGYDHARARKTGRASAPRAAHATRREDDADLDDRLFVGVYPTGIRYADKRRERQGDYLPLAFLSYKTLDLKWEPRVSVPLDLRYQIEQHAAGMKQRRGEDYPISSSGQTVKLGHARVREDGAQKFKVGDVVRRTAARMRSMGIVSGPVNGVVEGYAGKWPLVRWSDMSDAEEPMAQAEEGLELDKRAMARRSHARKIRR